MTGELAGHAERRDHARRVGAPPAGDVVRGTVIGRRAHHWEAGGEVHAIGEVQQLERRQSLIVVHADDRVEVPGPGEREQAVGGKEAIERITSYKMKGTFELSNLAEPGTVESWGKEPNKTLITIELSLPVFSFADQTFSCVWFDRLRIGVGSDRTSINLRLVTNTSTLRARLGAPFFPSI